MLCVSRLCHLSRWRFDSLVASLLACSRPLVASLLAAASSCANRRWVDAHHITHWARGGETKLDNLCLLCHAHHTAVHEGRVRVERAPGEALRFWTREGALIAASTRTQITYEPAGLLAMMNLDSVAQRSIRRVVSCWSLVPQEPQCTS